MKCSDTLQLLSAYIDNELAASQRQAVAKHLDECSSCQQHLRELRTVDETFSLLRTPTDLADKLVAAAVGGLSTASEQPVNRSSTRYGWAMLLAIAASIGLIVMMKPADTASEREHPTIGRLVRATGQVEVLEFASPLWKTLGERDAIGPGTRVRTGDQVRCEIEISSHALIRTDEGTELVIHQPGHLQMIRGQVWCRSPAMQPLQVDLAPSWIDSSQPAFSLHCPKSAEFQVSVQGDRVIGCSLADEPGELRFGERLFAVAPGESVSIDQAGGIQRSFPLAAVSKAWQLPLLAVGQTESGSGELQAIVQPLLAKVGRTKARHLNELQLRALGPPGAIPLLVYATSDDSRREPDLRYTAVALAGQMSDRAAIGLLEELALDADERISIVCKNTLQRLGEPE
jgi:ferric-dicitrate binding protein FerR (iron transport regulator)